MAIDDRESKSTRPQTIPRDMAGKWIARSVAGLRIVAIGDSFDDCERKAVEAGYSPNLVAIEEVPAGREVGNRLVLDYRYGMGDAADLTTNPPGRRHLGCDRRGLLRRYLARVGCLCGAGAGSQFLL